MQKASDDASASRRVADLDWRFILWLCSPPVLIVALLAVFALSSTAIFRSPFNFSLSFPLFPPPKDLSSSKIAVCLVGGARRFELTGPSIVGNILNLYPHADVFLHSPLDSNSFKFSFLKASPRIASVRIFRPHEIPTSPSQERVLSAMNSPRGIQGLLQYFNLVEGCLTMIQAHQARENFTFDWVIRTRVDSYWSGPLGPENFLRGSYLVPSGSSFGGLNDRLGIGDYHTSAVALSRLSMIPEIDAAGFRMLNSETSFKAQLTVRGVPFVAKRLPFCIISDRTYEFPPKTFGVPVAAIASVEPLSGMKCRPCEAACEGDCVGRVMNSLNREWSWSESMNGSVRLCDAHAEWRLGWEREFDRVAGAKLAAERRRVAEMKVEECIRDFVEMRRRAAHWESPPVEDICKLGIYPKS